MSQNGHESESTMNFEAFLQQMIDEHASDVFVVAGLPVSYRAGGRQVRTDTPALRPADTEHFVREIYRVAHRPIDKFLASDNHDEDSRSHCPASDASAPTCSASAARFRLSCASSPSAFPPPSSTTSRPRCCGWPACKRALFS